MTFATLTYNGIEKSLADWGISEAKREVANQAHDHFACDMMLPFDAADPLPYGSKIILQIGRSPAPGNVAAQSGLPRAGSTQWSGGKVFFIGCRVDNFRTGTPTLEKFDYKFAGPWEFFFERLVFQKLWWTWNGTANVADWRSQVILGQSVNAEIGPNDTIPGTSATNLMSIRQQVAEIIAYVVAQTTIAYGQPQFQSDNLTAEIDGVNYDLYETPGTNLIIPDYIAAGYQQAGKIANTANLNTVLRAPLDSVNDITCAEAMRKMLRWIGPMGSPAVWFDYSTTKSGQLCPTLHISTRDQLPAVSLPVVGQNAGFKIKRRDDLIPGAIGLKFRITGTWNGSQYTQVINDIVGTVAGTLYEGIGFVGALQPVAVFAGNMPFTATGGAPSYIGGSANSATMQALQNAARDFSAVTATIDMEGNSTSATTATIVTVPAVLTTPSGGGDALVFWKNVFPELADISSPDFFAGSTVTVVDDTESDINTTDTFVYLLTRGQVAPWMLSGHSSSGTPAQSVRAHITATFTGLENNHGVQTGHVQHQPKHATVTLLSIPGGTYVNQTVMPGEIIPYGLAGYIYNIEKIPQYEGTFTIQEQEVTDQCPLGNNLNLSGSLAEWAAMQACVQQIFYDLTSGRTALSFGPAAHLGAKDFVERLRINRGPRWFNLNGNNIQNAPNQNGGAQLGQDVSQLNPSPGPAAHDLQTFPISIADMAGNTYTYGPPGATLDMRPDISGTPQQPNYGNPSGLTAPVLPTFFLCSGSGGVLGAFARLSLSDLLGMNKQAFFRPMGICDIDGSTKTSYVFCTEPE